MNPTTGPLFSGDAACRAPPKLLGLQDANTGAVLSLCHVRRGGYIFQPKLKEGKSTVAPAVVRAYIPAEWKGFEVEAGGKRLEVTEAAKDGARFATFPVAVDGAWVIVAETGKAAEFRKVNRF